MPMEGNGESCPRCGAAYLVPAVVREKPTEVVKLSFDPVDRAWETKDFSKLTPEQITAAAVRITISTTDQIAKFEIAKSLGVVSGMYSFAFGAASEAIAGFARNLAGSGSSPQTEYHLTAGMRDATRMMQGRSFAIGADAIVGVRYTFEEFSGANNLGVIVVIATGTAVLLAAAGA